jgi:hypothetical protein
VWWLLVLATAMTDWPMLNVWARSCTPYTPGAPSTPSRWLEKLTVVSAGQ